MEPLGALDRSADVPAFRQIAADLRRAVVSGQYRPGTRVPSEAALMAHYGVARMTARQAIAELRGEGILVAEHGRGVFVRDMAPVRRVASERFARRHRKEGLAAFSAEAQGVGEPQVDQLDVSRQKPDRRVRELLGLSASAKVVARHRRYLLDGIPVELASSYVPLDIASGTLIEQANTGPGGIYARIEELGLTLAAFVEEVSARMPTVDERQRLQLPPGSPVLVVVRQAIDMEDRVVEVTDTVKAASRYLLEYRFAAQ